MHRPHTPSKLVYQSSVYIFFFAVLFHYFLSSSSLSISRLQYAYKYINIYTYSCIYIYIYIYIYIFNIYLHICCRSVFVWKYTSCEKKIWSTYFAVTSGGRQCWEKGGEEDEKKKINDERCCFFFLTLRRIDANVLKDH